jgi:hypothetical protein
MLDTVVRRLIHEGRVYKAKRPDRVRTKIHCVLRDRWYIGDLKYHGEWRSGGIRRSSTAIVSPAFERS